MSSAVHMPGCADHLFSPLWVLRAHGPGAERATTETGGKITRPCSDSTSTASFCDHRELNGKIIFLQNAVPPTSQWGEGMITHSVRGRRQAGGPPNPGGQTHAPQPWSAFLSFSAAWCRVASAQVITPRLKCKAPSCMPIPCGAPHLQSPAQPLSSGWEHTLCEESSTLPPWSCARQQQCEHVWACTQAQQQSWLAVPCETGQRSGVTARLGQSRCVSHALAPRHPAQRRGAGCGGRAASSCLMPPGRPVAQCEVQKKAHCSAVGEVTTARPSRSLLAPCAPWMQTKACQARGGACSLGFEHAKCQDCSGGPRLQG